ncbi:MAG TPA: hypothetical protein VHT74_08890 [Acetobacteraceae bacterium]|jgi:hypothetical protein|nr:hypothetical protein [Acetobacteraceae bacterium]
MVGTLKAGFRFARRPTAVIATVLLVGLSGQAFARGTGFNSGFGAEVAAPGTSPGESVVTSRGPAFVTGHLGSLETTTIPGSAGQGFLMNNGNGTSTLIVPGGIPQTVATPR